uniref:Putative Transcription factor BTF3 n=1 Tax=Daphnia magna TaxID=35525 RepID=A0A0N8A1N0_9CRUS
MQLGQAGTSERKINPRLFLFFLSPLHFFIFFFFPPPFLFLNFFFSPFLKLLFYPKRRYSYGLTRSLLIMGKQQPYSYYILNGKRNRDDFLLLLAVYECPQIKQKRASDCNVSPS